MSGASRDDEGRPIDDQPESMGGGVQNPGMGEPPDSFGGGVEDPGPDLQIPDSDGGGVEDPGPGEQPESEGGGVQDPRRHGASDA
jgi:hypothetical protein